MKLDNDGLSYRNLLPLDDVIAVVPVLLMTKIGKHRLFTLACGQAVGLDTLAQPIRQTADNAPAIGASTGYVSAAI